MLSTKTLKGVVPFSSNPDERIVDLGDIYLDETVTGQIQGTVYMPDGVTPVGKDVRVISNDGGGTEVSATTDANGRYELPLVFGGALIADTLEPDTLIKAKSIAEVRTDLFEEKVDGQDPIRILNVRLFGETRVAVVAA